MSAVNVTLGGMTNALPLTLRGVAAGQAGVVARRQVLRAGLPASSIAAKLDRGRWQRLHPGVYGTFSGAVAWDAWLWAAALYAGPGALLSHQAAAEVLGLTDDRCPVIHVTIPGNRRVRPPSGVAVHLSSFDYPRWRPQRGLPPYTFYADTVIDLAAASDNLDEVVAWMSRAITRRLATAAELREAAAARSRLRWRRELAEVIHQVAGGSHFPLEFRYDRDVERAHGLPAAARQVRFPGPGGSVGFRDRCYTGYGLIVELDGRAYHPPAQRDQDRARDNEAVATTGATLRYGWADIERTPCQTAGQVYRALRQRGYPGRLRPCCASCGAVAVA
jgi:hypothetical protein